MNPSLSKYMVAALMLCSLVAACAAVEYSGTSAGVQTAVAVAQGGSVAIPLPEPTPAGDLTGNYTKLEIMPSYIHFLLKPGAGDEQVVTVRNRDDKTITVSPFIQQNPFNGLYQVEKSWVSITPAQADIPTGQSTKFTIRATLPQDTPRGSYNTQIAFTDEQYPSPYPQTYLNYVHTLSLSIDAAITPVIRIDPMYISDQLEAGKEYRYTVNITNTGLIPIPLSPRVGSDNYLVYSSSGPQEPVLTDKTITIDAPSSVPPRGNVTMTVTVQVPPGKSGSYNGYIDLGIDDPAVREGEGRVSLGFQVWQQPSGAFTRQFSMSSPDTITVRLTATPQGYPSPGTVRNYPVREPAFDVTLAGPYGNVAVQQVKKEITGTVSVGADPLIYGIGNAGEYQQVSTQYVYTYTAQGRAGAWTLAVTPKNTQTFGYTISFGSAQDESPLLVPQPTLVWGLRGTNLV
jgi:hypothetical protein